MRKMFIIRLLKKIPQTKEQTNRARGAYSPSHNSRFIFYAIYVRIFYVASLFFLLTIRFELCQHR